MSIVVRTEQLQAMADAAPGQPMIQPCRDTQSWIEVRLVDQKGEPIPGERFEVRLPDQSLQRGTLDSQGSVRFEAIVAGQASIAFPGIEAEEWTPL